MKAFEKILEHFDSPEKAFAKAKEYCQNEFTILIELFKFFMKKNEEDESKVQYIKQIESLLTDTFICHEQLDAANLASIIEVIPEDFNLTGVMFDFLLKSFTHIETQKIVKDIEIEREDEYWKKKRKPRSYKN